MPLKNFIAVAALGSALLSPDFAAPARACLFCCKNSSGSGVLPDMCKRNTESDGNGPRVVERHRLNVELNVEFKKQAHGPIRLFEGSNVRAEATKDRTSAENEPRKEGANQEN